MEDPATTARLAAFRAAHPDVRVRPGEFGSWQALIEEADGERFAARPTLGALLDRLDVITGAAA
jgi:hypothetical protein